MGMLDIIRNNNFSTARSAALNDPVFRHMDRFFDDFVHDVINNNRSLSRVDSFIPAIDVEEIGKEVTVRVDLPGLKKDDIHIEIDGNTMTITGERKEELKNDKGASHNNERRFGKFERQFSLPHDINTDQVHASFENGVLHLNMQRQESQMRKSIPIQEGSSKQLAQDSKKLDKTSDKVKDDAKSPVVNHLSKSA